MEQYFDWIGNRDDISRYLLIGTLIVIRIIPITFITPFLGGKLVPPETRMGLALGLTILCFPHANSFTTGNLVRFNPTVYVVLMFKELFIGYAIAFLSALLFYAMEIGGRMLDVMRGSNMAEVQVPELQLRASPLGDFKFHLLLVVFMAINGHMRFIEALLESFRVVPIDGWPQFQGGFFGWVDQVLVYVASMFTIAFALVFPGLFATFMTDVVFGMLNRVAPQLNAYFMAMPVKAMAGIAMLFFTIGLLTKMLSDHAADSLLFLERMIGLMG